MNIREFLTSALTGQLRHPHRWTYNIGNKTLSQMCEAGFHGFVYHPLMPQSLNAMEFIKTMMKGESEHDVIKTYENRLKRMIIDRRGSIPSGYFNDSHAIVILHDYENRSIDEHVDHYLGQLEVINFHVENLIHGAVDIKVFPCRCNGLNIHYTHNEKGYTTIIQNDTEEFLIEFKKFIEKYSDVWESRLTFVTGLSMSEHTCEPTFFRYCNEKL